MRDGGWRWIHGIGVALALALISAAHYLTDPHAVASHNIFRRLYYLPVVWAAVVFGWRGGLAAALTAAAAYLPHAFFMQHHLDPAPPVDKAMEIALFVAVGGLGGLLMDRERRARARVAEQRLAKLAAEARAERFDGLINLSRGLAHEIRNPLGGIQGAMEILADEFPADSPRREMLDVALNETARLSKVLDDFLRFARPGRPELRPVHSMDLSGHLATLLRGEARQRGVQLQVADQGSCLRADPAQITQALLNLLRNALQASPEGGRVELNIAAEGGRVRFSVCDQGPGVPAELGQAIYDPYVTSREEGTGLGLPISAMLIEQNGGHLDHRSRQPGPGTEFFFELPACTGEEGLNE